MVYINSAHSAVGAAVGAVVGAAVGAGTAHCSVVAVIEFGLLQQLPAPMISLLPAVSVRLSTRTVRPYRLLHELAADSAAVPTAEMWSTHVSKLSHVIPLGPVYDTR
jgi:hypothetical protein